MFCLGGRRYIVICLLPMKQLRFAIVLFFTFLIGIPLMAQENNAKCVMIKTSQGETLEYYISSHPRLTQNNDKVTLTTDDETLEFGTVEIKKVYTSIATIKIVYMLDGEVYKTYFHHAGVKLKSEPAPTKEGYTFSGWSEIPSTMPAHDVTVTGTFTVNKYTITYMIDNEIYHTESVDYGSTITPPSAPEREGYTFEWIDIPETMPAHDITITGLYTTGIEGVYIGSNHEKSVHSIYLSELKPGEPVSVYSLSGKLILLEKASNQGDLTISLSSLIQEVYIIKTNSKTLKVSRK